MKLLDGLKDRGLLERARIVRAGGAIVQLVALENSHGESPVDHDREILRQDKLAEEIAYGAA